MFCYNCMHRISDENNYCPHCGRKSYPDRTPHHLTPGSDLKGRYLVGNALGEDSFIITYAARDLNIDERVVLREYYPMGHVHRNSEESNEVILNSETEAAYFDKGTDAFIAQAHEAKRNGKADVRDIFTANNTVYVVTSRQERPAGVNPRGSAPQQGEGEESDDYQDGYTGTRPEDYRSQTDISSTRQPAPKKKGKGGLIAGIVIGSAVVIGLAVTLVVLLNNGGKGKDDKTATTVRATVVTTAKPTEKPTDAPTKDPNIVEMPDVRGKKLSDAESQLRELGLKIEISREYSDEVAKDYILRQSIDGGQTLRKGDTVMLYVSDGPAPTEPPKPTAPPVTTPAPIQPSETQQSINILDDFG